MPSSPLLSSPLEFMSQKLLPKEEDILAILVDTVARGKRRAFQVHMDRFAVEILDADVRRRLDVLEGDLSDSNIGVLATLTALDQFGYIRFAIPEDILTQRTSMVLLTVLPAANLRVEHRKKGAVARAWTISWLRLGKHFTTIVATAGFILSVVALLAK